ncbi:hypothetical protein Droror1_Dr00007136 [Drosera rotundifolia]
MTPRIPFLTPCLPPLPPLGPIIIDDPAPPHQGRCRIQSSLTVRNPHLLPLIVPTSFLHLLLFVHRILDRHVIDKFISRPFGGEGRRRRKTKGKTWIGH